MPPEAAVDVRQMCYGAACCSAICLSQGLIVANEPARLARFVCGVGEAYDVTTHRGCHFLPSRDKSLSENRQLSDFVQQSQ